jgi:hypothetical protein
MTMRHECAVLPLPANALRSGLFNGYLYNSLIGGKSGPNDYSSYIVL